MDTRIFCFWVLSAGFQACTPVLVPAWFDPHTDVTKQSLAADERLEVYAENLEVNDRHIVFDVTIVNRNEEPVYVDPEAMRLMVWGMPYAAEPSAVNQYNGLSAGQLRRELEQKVRAANTAGFLAGLLSVGLVALDIAGDAGAAQVPEWTSAVIRQNRNRDLAVMAGLAGLGVAGELSQAAAFRAGQDLEFLDREYLHPGLVHPGQSLRGKVFFRSGECRGYRLILPLDGHEFVFEFRKARAADRRRLNATLDF